MREERFHLSLDRYDVGIILNALSTLKNNQIRDKRPTDPIDDLIIKISLAPNKKIKSRECYEER